MINQKKNTKKLLLCNYNIMVLVDNIRDVKDSLTDIVASTARVVSEWYQRNPYSPKNVLCHEAVTRYHLAEESLSPVVVDDVSKPMVQEHSYTGQGAVMAAKAHNHAIALTWVVPLATRSLRG